jgi:hypothetical protein
MVFNGKNVEKHRSFLHGTTVVVTPMMECGCTFRQDCVACLVDARYRGTQVCVANNWMLHEYELCSATRCRENFVMHPGAVIKGKVLSTEEGTARCQSCLAPHCSLRCVRCRAALYCDETCQRFDWQTHKAVCGKTGPQTVTFVELNFNHQKHVRDCKYMLPLLKPTDLTYLAATSLGIPHKLLSVPPHPTLLFPQGTCYASVGKVVTAFGGERELGWSVLNGKYHVEFEAHVCWRAPGGELYNLNADPWNKPETIGFLPHPGFLAWKEKDSRTLTTPSRIAWKQ